ncbi:unnamed protein product [Pleuronectes platessa]|uniref:Uncharacterized protein n=1 Tax=Pleuronectes platessa TaxID=8262 RepID=A0A9N7W1J0_PLEPL|nr:unnamed protein product [Pleuronectes platessa]
MSSLPPRRISLLPRTHVWCSGRVSALLFGIPSSEISAVSSTLFYTLGFSRVSDTLTLQTVVGSGRTKTCRWRLCAHSDTQRQRVPTGCKKVDERCGDSLGAQL